MVWNRSAALLTLFSVTLVCDVSSTMAETVLLDFNSALCGPCRQMRPVVRQLAAAGYKVRDVDIDREPQLAAKFGVSQVPTFLVLVDGRETNRVVGLTSFARLQQMLGAPPAANHVSPIAQGALSIPEAGSNLAAPQAGRIVAIQAPESNRPSPTAAANVSLPSPGPATPAAGSPENHKALIEATVKITVEDPQGKSAGTGTIVDARSGEALVLTCGHIFRSSAGKGPITVTLFHVNSGSVQTGSSFTGRLIEYDLQRDLGLVSFRPTVAIKPAPIALSNAPIPPGTGVTSVGCNGGQAPTIRTSRVTANDRYQGPGNIEVAGAPVEGRSGGGLFNSAGQLVGVCFAADPQENEGLYASLRSIHEKLQSLGLTMVLQPPSAEEPSNRIQPPPQIAQAPDPSFAIRGQEPALLPTEPDPTSNDAARGNLSAVEQAAWEEIQRRGANSEVICIIRPHDPEGKSEVITLNHASPQFVRQLLQRQSSTGDAAGQLLR
ncbi:MAG: trypsin-like peptidase domain-containing protein [Pirellulales bacterium]|nr:trypsin-like peptidase domain-containing protein [Pirellulales bacterium]